MTETEQVPQAEQITQANLTETTVTSSPSESSVSVKSEEKKEIWASGSRKTSTTRVKLASPGTGKITINGRTLDKFFGGHNEQKKKVLQPLNLFKQKNEYDIKVNVKGGGITGQAEAIRLAIARGLSKLSPELRPLLKEHILLRRDPRMVERKKSGQPKARKKFQWTKR